MPKILIVEDEPQLLELYKIAFIKEAGFEVATATDGLEALDAVSQNKPDLILLDIMMPKMSGLEVLSKLRESEDTKNLPVLMLTNSSDIKNISEAASLNADEYVIKTDIVPAKLIKKVKDKLGMQ